MIVRKLAARSLAGALGLLLALSLVLVPVPALAAMPESGHIFYGNVSSSGEPVALGTPITARVPDGPDYTTETLDAEGSYSLLVEADDPDIPGKDGAYAGDLIEFYVDEVLADTYAFEIRGLTELNLIVTVPDTTPPTIGITIADPVNLANVGAVAVTITSDEDGIYSYIISDGVIELTDTDAIIADEPVELSLDLSTLADGPMTADASVEDADENVGEAQTSATKDTIPPTVVSTTPEADAPSVAIDVVVSATFSEDIQEGANFGGIAISGGATGVVSASTDGVTLIIAHGAFDYETTYEVTIPAGAVEDLSGNPLAEAEVWSFTTATEAVAPVSFTTTLLEGWNLLSTPIKLDADSDSLEQILSESLANIEASWRWDVQSQQWAVPTGYELSPLEAVYVKVSSGASATAEFVPYQDYSALPSRELQPGLNLIGPAPALGLDGFPDTPLDEALASSEEAPGGLRGYTMVVSPGLNQTGWAYALGGEIQDLLPFKGYWVVMENGDTLYGSSTTPISP